MNRDQFLNLVSHFSERALPARIGRHVYLWHGDSKALTAAVPAVAARTLDLHRVAAELAHAPRSVDAARRLLSTAIRARLAALAPAHGQQVTVVTGCDLLSRYRVRLTPFFESVSEQWMIVFVVSPAESRFEPSVPLADYVVLDPDAPLVYLASALDKQAVIDM